MLPFASGSACKRLHSAYPRWNYKPWPTFAIGFSRQGRWLSENFYGLGLDPQKKEAKEMKAKKQFDKLSKSEQKNVELEYHGMKPVAFKELMTIAQTHTPSAIRLPVKLIETLKDFAESAREGQYQAMVKRWIEERLRHEAGRLSRV